MALNPRLVHARLRRAAAVFRWSRGARFIISGLAVSLFFLTFFLLCDTQFHFGAAGRWAGFALTVSSLAAGIMMALPVLFRRISDASMARRVELSCADSRNVLINAVQFDGELSADSPLRSALFEEMEDPFSQVRWSDVFDLSLLKKLALALAAVALVLGAWGLIRPEYFINSARRIFLPASDIAPLTRTKILNLSPGDVEVAHGGGVDLKITLGGDVPNAAWVNFHEDGSGWQRELLDHNIGVADYTFAWKDIRRPVEYYIEAGDARSVTYKVTVRPKTAIRVRTAEIDPPAYTKLPRRTVKNFSTLQDVVPGSHVRIGVEFNAPVTELRTTGDKEQEFTTTRQNSTHWSIDAKIMASQTMKSAYRDTDSHADEENLQVSVKPDEPPKINISTPAEGHEIVATPDGALTVQFTATDDFGLASVALYKSTNDRQDAQLVHEWKDVDAKKSFTAGMTIPLREYASAGDENVTFCIVAKDRNDVTGPGVAISRPMVVSLKSTEALQKQSDEENTKLKQGLDDLIKLQKTNLDETRDVSSQAGPQASDLARLLDRQSQISMAAVQIADAAGGATPEIRADLRSLAGKEMKEAVLALRNAGNAAGQERTKFLADALKLEAAILARLQGSSIVANADAQKGRIQDLIASVDHLLQEQRAILRETSIAAAQAAKPLSDRQDALAEESSRVRKNLEKDAQNAAIGDQDFRVRLTKVTVMFGEMRIYEEMLLAADALQSAKFTGAAITEKSVVANLTKILDFLNQWQLANAQQKVDALKKEAGDMKEKLQRLAEIQKEIIEKSKELAHKDQFNSEDQATAREIQQSKDLMAEVIEQMLTDAHAFPDLKPSNELRSELTQIYEDVQQADKQQVEDGKLKPQEIAVQKEDGILKAIEQAQKIAEDMEMWLPNSNETQKWLMENFDKSEIPEIPNLPLPDAFEDIVGKLLDDQKNIEDQVQDAASNQAMAQNPANGWEIRDGPMPGFGAQGKSGNERPNKNEQTGRSSGGREGMSDGEMVGDRADNLEGTKPDARRTNDPMQQGHVQDNGGISSTRATGGGKAGGYSDRNGMDGNAPLRSVNAPPAAAKDTLAVQQALLSEKTAKAYAQASLLYLRTGGLPDVARLMDDAGAALKEGRLQDFESLHRKIVARLNEVKGEIHSGNTLVLPSGETTAQDKQLLGGDEGSAPEQYKKQVADYYRSLAGQK